MKVYIPKKNKRKKNMTLKLDKIMFTIKSVITHQ